ncbi:hypothetical protein ATPR_1438 [Acetobacter tropicalis NBRC 101654]|uniref:Uncharacterized protein n=1 Tax=Acetobacter tropicalis NBRC 101654 TaxID=749388 RepID=F7VDI9_9PROT|nr:hypothetical protein ATPR_1438 [Acetobacter tropicalis NBRC 101654]
MMPTTSEKNSMTVPERRMVLIRNSVAFFYASAGRRKKTLAGHDPASF